ncbi:MAG: rod shape-determining protein RodA [Myxococcota bacterium]
MPGIDRRLIQHFEWPLFSMALLLGLIGVLNLVSAAPESAAGIPATAWRQLLWLGVGLALLFVCLLPDYRILERLAIPAYVACIVALVAVLIFGPVINGTQRWLPVFGLRVQPSEITKVAMLILFARTLVRHPPDREIGMMDLVGPVALVALPAILVLRQPDLGNAMLLVLVAGAYLLIARSGARLLPSLGVGAIALSAAGWFFVLREYQKERVLTFLNPERDPLGAAYHSIQSQIAVGSGGLFGRGFLQGPQSQLDFLPEQQTDFVFSVLGEEWGFLGACFVLLLYLGVMIRVLMIAHASKDQFGAYLTFGVTALFFWPTAINVAMVLGLFPVVGVPLPLLSYGGSSMLTSMIALGLAMNVSMRRYVF